MWPHDNRVLDKFLHAVDQAIAVATWHEAASALGSILFSKLLVSHRDRGLVRDREHPHPPTKDAKRVDGVKGLRSTRDLSDSQRTTLRRSYTAGTERDPINLVLEYGGQVAMLLGRDPDVTIAPATQRSQFLDFRVVMLLVVLDW